MSNVPWTHKSVPPMTEKRAYNAGWTASKNTRTYDMDAAEYRFIRKHGKTYVNAFNKGWTDYSNGREKGSSL